MRRKYAIINRREYKDLIVNKEKMENIKNEIRSFGLSFLRDQKREEQKKRKREKKRRRRGRRRKRRAKGMDFYGFLWIILDACIDFYGKKSNHKPIFDEFGSKRTLLGILVVFWTWVG